LQPYRLVRFASPACTLRGGDRPRELLLPRFWLWPDAPLMAGVRGGLFPSEPPQRDCPESCQLLDSRLAAFRPAASSSHRDSFWQERTPVPKGPTPERPQTAPSPCPSHPGSSAWFVPRNPSS